MFTPADYIAWYIHAYGCFLTRSLEEEAAIKLLAQGTGLNVEAILREDYEDFLGYPEGLSKFIQSL